MFFEIACKIKQKKGDNQILYFKSDISAVIERVLPFHECLACHEGVDVQWVLLALLVQLLLTFSEGGAEEGIAVGGKDYLVGLEVEGIYWHMLFRNREAVDDGERDVLSLRAVDDVSEDIVTCRVMGQQLIDGRSLGKQLFGSLGTLGSVYRLLGFGILQQLSVQQALAVAHHPYLSLQSAIDDGRASQSLLRVLNESLQMRLLILFADIRRHSTQELLTRHLLRGMA